MFKLLFSFFILYYFTIPVLAQDENYTYIGLDLLEISKIDYLNKLKSKEIAEAVFKIDSIHYKKLFFNEFFGKLEIAKKSQLNKLLYQRYQIDSTKIWVIHYVDSLPNLKKLPKRSKIEFKPLESTQESIYAAEFLNNKKYINRNSVSVSKIKESLDLTELVHNASYKGWHKKIRKENKAFRKFKNAVLLHVYDFNAGFPVIDRDVIWYQDPYRIFKNIFSDGIINYNFILIHPDGSFFVNYNFCHSFEMDDLLNYKKFSMLKTERNTSLMNTVFNNNKIEP